MNRIRPIWLFLPLFLSCGRAGTVESVPEDSLYYFEGALIRSGQYPVMRDFATGGELSVRGLDFSTNRDADLTVENMGDSSLYISFMGSFVLSDTTATGGYRSVRVASLLEAGLAARGMEHTVAGLYSSHTEKNRVDLLLNGSYRFRQTVFRLDDDQKEDLYLGEWRMLSPNQIVLYYRSRNGEDLTRERRVLFDSATDRITQEVEGRQIIYDKTYI